MLNKEDRAFYDRLHQLAIKAGLSDELKAKKVRKNEAGLAVLKTMDVITYAMKLRMYPTQTQQDIIDETLRGCRYVYNFFLDKANQAKAIAEKERDDAYALVVQAATAKGEEPPPKPKVKTRFLDCIKYQYLTEEKERLPWLKHCIAKPLWESARNLRVAYQRMFVGLSKYPRFKSAYDHHMSYSSYGVRKEGSMPNKGRINLPVLGYVNLQDSVPFEGGTARHYVISKNATGAYYLSITCLLSANTYYLKNTPTTAKVGIDIGLKEHNYAVYSDGSEATSYPSYFLRAQEHLARLQQKLALKKKGSRNYQKMRLKVAKLHEHISNQRNDFQHKLSKDWSERYATVFMEDLDEKSMTTDKNSDFAKRLHDAAWAELKRKVTYKMARHNKKVITVDRFFASSQLCHVCGFKNPAVQTDQLVRWECPQCHTIHERDENAAMNIYTEGLRIEAAGCMDGAKSRKARRKGASADGVIHLTKQKKISTPKSRRLAAKKVKERVV